MTDSLSEEVRKPVRIPESIPQGWCWSALCDLCRPKQWPTISKDQLLDQGYLVYGANGPIGFYSEYTHADAAIAITCRGATCGTVNVAPPRSYITGNAMALDDVDVGRVVRDYLFHALVHRGLSDVISGSAQPQITRQGLSPVVIPLPPLPEQRKIAAILSSVDEAIEGTQAVIDQLQVVKKAMMADLLTRGIPGRHKSFKQTEIGEIPAEWDVMPLCEVASLQTGLAKGKPIANGLELPYLRVANVQDGYVDLSEIKTITVESSSIERYRLKAGDVLFTEGGDADKLGRGCVWLGQVNPCLHQNHVFAVRPNPERLLSRYLAYVAAAPVGKQYFLNCAKQTTNLASINSTQLKALPIPLATVDEQTAIVAVVESCDARIAAEVSCLESLRSTKQALMSVLLTGEIRVQVDEEVAA